MKHIILILALVSLILLCGCIQEVTVIEYVQNDSCPVCTVHTTIINQTIYINNTVECNCTNITHIEIPETNNSYILTLIRRLEWYEEQQWMKLNLNDCLTEMERYNKSLKECNESLTKMREALE